MSGVASRLWGWDWAAAARTATSDHTPEQIPGFIQFAHPKSSVVFQSSGGWLLCPVSCPQHQPQSMQGGLHPYLQGITCVVYTAPLLTLKPFLEGNFLVLCKNLNHTLKQAQGLTVLATLIWIKEYKPPWLEASQYFFQKCTYQSRYEPGQSY